MGEIIKSVAEVIQSFLTINLLDSRNILSTLDFDEKSKKRRLSVKLKGSESAVRCCQSELWKLRDNGFVMDAKIEISRECYELTANFYYEE